MSLLERAWYKPWYSPMYIWIWLLLPFSLLFYVVSLTRRWAYRVGLLKSEKIDIPVIIVGNISVGGNGKTPLVVYLCDLLRQHGYYPGVLSRGYGGKSDQYPLLVNKDTQANVCGDEPLLLCNRVNCPVVVDPVRARGARALKELYKCNVIICDDGLQHYALQRDIEIVVMDGERRLGNGCLLPMGPLREGKWRLDTVDFVVVNGGKVAKNEYNMSLQPGRVINAKFSNQSKGLNEFATQVTAAAGIGNPERFFSLLQKKGVPIKQRLAFSDHHAFSASDLPDDTVLMTEKDAVKCAGFAKDSWWYLPVTATLTEQFRQQFLKTLKALNK